MANNANVALKNPWVISWIVLFVILMVSMAYRIMLGIQTHPGLVTADYYDRGQNYEQNMLKIQAQHAAWSMRIEGTKRARLNKKSRYSFTFKNKQGDFITADKVVFYAYRPSDQHQDFSIPMHEVAKGTYQADVAFPLKGAWDVLISATVGDNELNQPYFVAVRTD